MKGLSSVPNLKKLSSVYYDLQFAEEKKLDKEIALYSQWVRLDPRLGEILVSYMANFWEKHNPIFLNKEIKKQVWPQALGVILEQTELFFLRKKTKDPISLFRAWYSCVMCDIKPACNELFFFETYPIGSTLFYEQASHAIKSYRKWGYLGKALMLNKTISLGKTLIPSKQRKVILKNLLKKRKTLTVKEYLSELNLQVHPKQAQMDLKNNKKLSPKGYTRNRVYIVKK